MKPIGYGLVTIAFLVGAFLTSLDETKVKWALFIPAIVVGFVGVGFLSRSEKQEAKSEGTLTRNREDLEASLSRIIGQLEDLDSVKDEIALDGLRTEIDQRFREDLSRFADARKTLSHLYGLSCYAEIMSAFAAGERYLNRVWSASADGYADEARAYLPMALTQFKEAQSKLNQAGDAAGDK